MPEWSKAVDEVLAEDHAADYDVRAEIVAFRKRVGLPVDDALIEEVLAHAERGRAHPGMWETEQEAARRERRQALIDASEDAVEAYVQAHADNHVDTWYEWTDNEPTCVVAFADDLAPHVEALKNYPAVRVTARPHSDPTLPGITEHLISADPPDGTMWWWIWIDEATGVIDLKGWGTDEAAAAAWLAQRYGDRVRLTWEPSHEVRPASWQLWKSSPDEPNLVTVYWQTNREFELDHVEVEEAADSVRVTVLESQFKGQTLLTVAYRSTAARLEQPVGTRAMIDAVTERPRRRL